MATGKYTPNKGVKDYLRKKVLEKYGYRCAKCGYGFLEIHHIDGDHTNNSLNNLIPLCKLCHIEEHWKKESEIPNIIINKIKRLARELIRDIVKKELENIFNEVERKFKIKLGDELEYSRRRLTFLISRHIEERISNKILDEIKKEIKFE